MVKKVEYVRIGTQIYKITYRPNTDGTISIILVKWTKEALVNDGLRYLLKTMPKFDDFVNWPMHIDYKQKINNHYNKYHKIDLAPTEGCFDYSLGLVRHIFQEQYDLGLDYLTLLLLKPLQKLPILCFVSKENNTAKSTLTQLLKIMFEENAIYADNDAINSNFNSSWADALIVMIEETLLTKRSSSERLKNLTTAFNAQKESKGTDRTNYEVFTHFVLCSNNENDFVVIDQNETRYWVIKTPVIEVLIDDYEKKIAAEKQHFYHYLINRPLSTKKESRLWFNPKLTETEALKKVKRYSRNRIEFDILELFSIIFDEKQVEEINFIPNDLMDWYRWKFKRNCELFQVKSIIRDNWNLEMKENSLAYVRYIFDKKDRLEEKQAKGRYYRLTREQYKRIDEMMNT